MLWVSGVAAQPRPFHYPAPAADAVEVMPGISFARSDTLELSMDVYRPSNHTGGLPALIFYTMFWPPDSPPRLVDDWAKNWARIAAAGGFVAIIPDIRAEPGTGSATTPTRALGDDFQRLVAHVVANAPRLGVDPERIAVLAASGSVAPAFPAVEDPAMNAVKAAIMYYGAGEVDTFRLDLPVLLVRAGLDHSHMNDRILALASEAARQNAPVTLVNYPSGHHGFELVDDQIATRQVIDQTLDFVRRATLLEYQASLREGRLEAMAAAQRAAGNYGGAALTYAELKQQRSDDPGVAYAYATALLDDQQYRAACAEFRRLAPDSFGAVVPGARACLMDGTPDTVIELLRSVPADWLKSEYLGALHTDPVFAPLRERADFKMLFQ